MLLGPFGQVRVCQRMHLRGPDGWLEGLDEVLLVPYGLIRTCHEMYLRGPD